MRVLLTGIMPYLANYGVVGEDLMTRLAFRPPVVGTQAELTTAMLANGNTGNYLIGEGCLYALANADVEYIPFWALRHYLESPNNSREYFREKFDLMVVSSANLLRSDYSADAEFAVFSEIDLPIMFMSLGNQRFEDLQPGRLPQGTVNLINMIAQREHMVFTRGLQSEAFLRASGVANVQATGCPSLYAFPHNTVAALNRLRTYEHTPDSAVTLHGYYSPNPQGSQQDIHNLRGRNARTSYILQDELLFYELTLNAGEEDVVYDGTSGRILAGTNHPLDGKDNIQLNMFFSTEQWRTWCAAHDFNIGRRLHGAIIAMQAGTPSLPIAVDDRMREMLGFSGLPFLDIDAATDDTFTISDVNRAIKAIDFDRSIETYQANEDRFRAALTAMGL